MLLVRAYEEAMVAGGGWGVGAQHKHKHNDEAWFMHRPSLKVVMRNRRPGRGKGLRARRSDNLRCGTKHPRPSLPPPGVTPEVGRNRLPYLLAHAIAR